MTLSLPHTIITDHRDTTRNFEVLGPVIDRTSVSTTSLERKVASLESTVSSLAVDSGWVNVSVFTNTWKAGGVAPAYRKQGNTVRLRGRLATGENNKAAFTLPEGFRPAKTAYYDVASGAVATQNAVAIATTGVLTPIVATEEPSLDGITFTID